ncbi:MAG: hypothetical protein HC939_11310 [Pleurocapsa sp. SU_5_0]|nr:hypothetical protein [Pleurocapsa sp. SU_5_0]
MLNQYRFCLTASIITGILFSLSGFGLSLHDYTIQDDARQHVFWLQRLNDSELFRDDLIADYFSSVAPAGYKVIYWLANRLGVEPLIFNKILPLLLGVGTSIYLFLVTLEIFPVPLAGFFASLLLNQNLWLLDDLVSGTPRSFFYILFLGFIYHLLRQQLLPCILLIVLQGLFYPQVVLISAGILCLNLITQKQGRYLYLTGLIAAVLTVSIYKLQTAEFSEVITLATAKQLPEFYPAGRSAFFSDNPWYFWLVGKQSGFFPFEWQYFLMCSFGLLLPFISKLAHIFPLVDKINAKLKIIWQIVLTSFIWYALSHLMLFRLHLPSRYSQHTNRIAIAILSGITLTILIHKLIQQIAPHSPTRQFIITAIAISALLYPTYAVQAYPHRLGYVTAKTPELYQFLRQQPKDIAIATLGESGDFIPSFAQRSVLTAREYSIPYHWDYYKQIRQRTQDLIQAQYSPNPADFRQFIQQYQIDLWLIDRPAFSAEYLQQNDWLNQFQPEIQQAIANLEHPAIAKKIDQCSIFQTPNLNVLTSKCLLEN